MLSMIEYTKEELANEEWRPIKGYEGLYEVSNLGRIKGLPRKVNNHTGYIQLKERFLRGHPITKGYLQLQLSSRPNRVLKLIHVIVAEAFIPNPNNFPQVNHLNGIKHDNRVCNLEWCDNSMNQLHAYKTGLNWHRENAGRPKRPIILVDKMGNIIKFPSIADATRFLGLKRNTNLIKVLKHKYNCKTIKGYRAFYDD